MRHGDYDTVRWGAARAKGRCIRVPAYAAAHHVEPVLGTSIQIVAIRLPGLRQVVDRQVASPPLMARQAGMGSGDAMPISADGGSCLGDGGGRVGAGEPCYRLCDLRRAARYEDSRNVVAHTTFRFRWTGQSEVRLRIARLPMRRIGEHALRGVTRSFDVRPPTRATAVTRAGSRHCIAGRRELGLIVPSFDRTRGRVRHNLPNTVTPAAVDDRPRDDLRCRVVVHGREEVAEHGGRDACGYAARHAEDDDFPSRR